MSSANTDKTHAHYTGCHLLQWEIAVTLWSTQFNFLAALLKISPRSWLSLLLRGWSYPAPTLTQHELNHLVITIRAGWWTKVSLWCFIFRLLLKPVSHVGGTFTTTRNESQLRLARRGGGGGCGGGMKSHSAAAGRRLAELWVGKKKAFESKAKPRKTLLYRSGIVVKSTKERFNSVTKGFKSLSFWGSFRRASANTLELTC